MAADVRSSSPLAAIAISVSYIGLATPGGITMTMHADQLVGAPVIDSDGQAVGTVEQVFRDDVDGTPSWARIRQARGCSSYRSPEAA